MTNMLFYYFRAKLIADYFILQAILRLLELMDIRMDTLIGLEYKRHLHITIGINGNVVFVDTVKYSASINTCRGVR
jgi:hypothetical protein